MAAPTHPRPGPDRAPASANLLAAVQFVAAAAGVIVLLGNGTVDGELSGKDIALAVGVALVGAAIFGSTTSGGRYGWWVQLVIAPVTAVFGGLTMIQEASPGTPVLVLGLVWTALLLVPTTRAWFLRAQLSAR